MEQKEEKADEVCKRVSPVRDVDSSPIPGPSRADDQALSSKIKHLRIDTRNLPVKRKILMEDDDENVQKIGKKLMRTLTTVPEKREDTEVSCPTSDNSQIISKNSITNNDDSEEIFKYLVKNERQGLVPEIPSGIRAYHLDRIMRVLGTWFPNVIQGACWYLDTYLSNNLVSPEKLETVAAVSCWISMKVLGNRYNHRVGASKLASCWPECVTSEQVKKTEVEILSSLKFPQQPIVPQEYITYMCSLLDNTGSEIKKAASFLCLAGMMVDKALCTQFPSVIASASVKTALLHLKQMNHYPKLQTIPIYQAAEKKTKDMSAVCSIIEKAARTVGSPWYKWKAPILIYGQPPDYTAQKVLSAIRGTTLQNQF